MKEVKRVAKVGEQIKVVMPFLAHGYSKGQVFTVRQVNSESVEDHSHVVTNEGHVILTPEYVVLETMPTMVQRLEGVLSVMETQVQTVRQLLHEAKSQAVESVKEVAQNTRAMVIQEALHTIAELEVTGRSLMKDLSKLSPLHGCYYVVQYHVNEAKRTVVAIVKDKPDGKVLARGVAKCDPSDSFNDHVGKAIALQRALGLTVNRGFMNIPRH